MSDYPRQATADDSLPLFAAVETGLCRASDPPTSAAGAVHIASKLTGKRAVFVACLRIMGKPSTASEVARYAVAHLDEPNAESIRKRAVELVREHVTEYAGVRQCAVTGQSAQTYALAEWRR